jgi:hypothetical protein
MDIPDNKSLVCMKRKVLMFLTCPVVIINVESVFQFYPFLFTLYVPGGHLQSVFRVLFRFDMARAGHCILWVGVGQ